MKGYRTLYFSMGLSRPVCVCVVGISLRNSLKLRDARLCDSDSVQSCFVLESKAVTESTERHRWA